MKVTPILYSRPLSSGNHQIKIRVHNEGKTSYINTGFDIPKNKWDNQLRRVKEHKSFPEHERINSRIEELVRGLKGYDEVFNQVGQYEFNFFLDCFNDDIRLKESQEKYNTYRKLKVVRNHLINFVKENGTLRKVDIEFLKRFRIYLFDKGLKQNGVHTYFKVFRNQLNKASLQYPGRFDPKSNPFHHFKVKHVKEDKVKLSLEQLNKIISAEISDSGLMDIRNFFLFSFYSAGMRISDVISLKWKNLKDGRLTYKMRKTGKTLSLPLNDKQVAILSMYLPEKDLSNLTSDLKNEETFLTSYTELNKKTWSGSTVIQTPFKSKVKKDENTLSSIPAILLEVIELMSLKRGENFVFPLMENKKKYSQTEFLRQISSKSALINKGLKELSKSCDLGVKLSFHVARHTLSDLMRKTGVGLYDISKILGHSDIATTEKYLKSIDQEATDSATNSFYQSL